MKRQEPITIGTDSKLRRIRHLELEKKKATFGLSFQTSMKKVKRVKNDYIEALKYSPSMLENC